MVAIADESTTERLDAHALIVKWHRYIWRLSNRRARFYKLDEGEVYQEIVLHALKYFASYDPQWSFSTWLDYIVRSAVGHMLQARNRSVRARVSLAMPMYLHAEQSTRYETMADTVLDRRTPDIVDSVDDRLRRETIRAAVEQLEPETQQLIWRRFERGETLAASEGKLVAAALRTLRDAIPSPD